MFKLRFSFWTFTGSIVLSTCLVSPVRAQFPSLQDLNLQPSNLLNQPSTARISSGCIRLDGRCLAEIAAPRAELSERIQDIEQRLDDIKDIYLKNETVNLDITQKEAAGNIPNIYVSVGEKQIRLMSVTDQDARLKGVDINTRTDELIEEIQQGLQQAKQERQPEYLTRQVSIAAGTGAAIFVVGLTLGYWERRFKRSKQQLASVPSGASTTQPISTQLNKQQEWNIKEVQHRLFQLTQAGLITGGTLFILGLFPYTRMLQVLIIISLRIPVRLGGVSLISYVAIRLSYALIDRFSSVLAKNSLLTPETNHRLQLRISTISSVTKGIVTVTLIVVGTLVALATIGVNTAPLLAGAGIIGVGLSLASQNLIRDAINGFFIILEDQYAVGDVINVADVGGLVEHMNLRITQLRDAEGRLITIPNSEIKVVANLSSHWSRADLNIPVAYYADVDKALELIDNVAQQMSQNELWREQIVDQPQVLGVDDFGLRGVIIRVWIKTKPLKQWDVAREFRRRLKTALDKAGISIPVPQQEVWFNNGVSSKSSQDGQPTSAKDGTGVL